MDHALRALTPIPYKLVTIASGFAGFNFTLFMVLSAITRGLRFGMVSWASLLISATPVRHVIEKYMEVEC